MKTPNAFSGGLKATIAAAAIAVTYNPSTQKTADIDAKVGEINSHYNEIDQNSSLDDQREAVRKELQTIGFILLNADSISQHRSGVDFIAKAHLQNDPDLTVQSLYDHAAYEEALRAQECQYIIFPKDKITPYKRNLRPQYCFNLHGNDSDAGAYGDYNTALKLFAVASPEMKDRIVNEVRDPVSGKPSFVELLEALGIENSKPPRYTNFGYKIEELCDVLGDSIKPEMLTYGLSKETLCYEKEYEDHVRNRSYSAVRKTGSRLGKNEEQIVTDFLNVLPQENDEAHWLDVFAFIEWTEKPDALRKAIDTLGNKEIISKRAYELSKNYKPYRHKMLADNVLCLLGETSWSRDFGDCSQAAIDKKLDVESCDEAKIFEELAGISFLHGIDDPLAYILDRYHFQLLDAATESSPRHKLGALSAAGYTLKDYMKMADKQLNPACKRMEERRK